MKKRKEKGFNFGKKERAHGRMGEERDGSSIGVLNLLMGRGVKLVNNRLIWLILVNNRLVFGDL